MGEVKACFCAMFAHMLLIYTKETASFRFSCVYNYISLFNLNKTGMTNLLFSHPQVIQCYMLVRMRG